MSSIFDTAVYSMRKGVPFARPYPMDLMSEKAFESDNGIVIFSVQKRHAVASRLWWTMRWIQDGTRYRASAQDWELCLWRAIQIHKTHDRRMDLERGPVTSAPVGFGIRSSDGWQNGDGI